KIEVTGEIDEIEGFFRKEDEINIVRIIQESVNNVLKHAEATSVNVVLSLADEHIVLTISDNGRGMEDHSKRSHGLGMNDISERIQLLEGTMQIESSPGKGTTLKFQFI
ncbi:MAG: ATP-binding protein, partial [Bacteroidota bacterium]